MSPITILAFLSSLLLATSADSFFQRSGPHYGGYQQQHGYGGGQQSHGHQRLPSSVSCKGKKDGTIIGDLGSNCQKFFTCIAHNPILASCPYGKRFDARFGACIYSNKAVCTGRLVTPSPLPPFRRTTTPATTTSSTGIVTLTFTP